MSFRKLLVHTVRVVRNVEDLTSRTSIGSPTETETVVYGALKCRLQPQPPETRVTGDKNTELADVFMYCIAPNLRTDDIVIQGTTRYAVRRIIDWDNLGRYHRADLILIT